MATLLKGAPFAVSLAEKDYGNAKTLAIVRLGAKEDDLAYEKSILRRAEKVGATVRVVELGESATTAEVLMAIKELNADDQVGGILLFRPLPSHVDEAVVCDAIGAEKDIDGASSASLASVFAGYGAGFAPCTAAACVALLKHHDISLAGKHAVVVGRSLTVGKPLAQLLLAENATVTVCHSKTKNLAEICRGADILLVAIGRARMIDGSFVSPGQIVVDVGIHVDEDGNLCGDVDFDTVAPIVDAITPVPGGVGSVTTALLLDNLRQKEQDHA